MTITIEDLKTQLQFAEHPQDFVDVMNELSWQYLVRDANVGRLFAEQAEMMAYENDYIKGIADSRRNQAYGLYYSGQYRQAIELAHEVITDYIQLTDYAGLAKSHAVIGLCEASVSNYAEALEHYLKALDFAHHLADKSLISTCYNHIAQVYTATDKFETAIEHYENAVMLLIEADDQLGLADVFNNLAHLFNQEERYDDALNYAQRAIQIYDMFGYDVGLARVYNTIGSIYTNWSHYAQAQEYLLQSRDKANRNAWLAIELTALHQLARLDIKRMDLLSALDYLDQAAMRAEMLGQTDNLAQIHHDFAIVYKKMDDFELALQHYEAYHALYRQNFAEERDAKLRSLEIAYKTQTVRAEAEFQRERAEALEQRRQQDKQYFERLNTMRDEFVHSTTHDLKNPLATIKTAIYLLRKVVSHPKASEYIQRIETQTERMNLLITDMLELAKLETGRALARHPASLTELILTVLDDYKPIADERRIHLHFDNRAQQTIAEIDTSLLHRALSNLISNAIKYTNDEGDATICIEYAKDSYTITISDTGVGIPKEELPYIFDTFYRVEESQSRSVEGTGLGLAIVKTIIEQHEGHIQVESTLGIGTTFTITLPASHS
ncbi:MAG: tetratricopeptide repeat-containing sensor histidine kinase [Chloroflexota bacterium]